MQTDSEDRTWAVNLEILDNYFKEVITPNFKIEYGGRSTSSTFKSDVFKGQIRLPSSFISYKSSDYYHEVKDKKFIHFTSLNTFFRIINNGYFLATQFSNHDDPLELLFAGNELKEVINKKSINQLKEYVFSLSMCAHTTETESFNMWRNYGDNGNGIGIVVSFYPNEKLWKNSFLSKVYYENEENCLDKFKKFQAAHLRFLKNNPTSKMERNNSGEEGIADYFALFLAFHKRYLYEGEQEVRFLKSLLPQDAIDVRNETIELLLNKKNEKCLGYRIPILSKGNLEKRENALKSKKKVRGGFGPAELFFPPGTSDTEKLINGDPFIVIEKVILGYRFTETDLQKFKKMENDINRKVGNSRISFELTSLSKIFHG
jgi:hypothetical protein